MVVLNMKKKIITGGLLLVALIVALSGCTANDPITDTIYFTGIDADQVNADQIDTEEVNADQVQLGGATLLIPAYGEIYQTAFETIECDVAGTYYIVDGPTTAGELLGFENNGLGRLTYTDITPNRIGLATTAVTISVPADDRPATIRSMIYINGVSDNASLIGEYISDADPADALPIMALVELQQNDYIEIYISSDSANTTVTVNAMTLVVTTVD
jgi:hypothetical protein